MSFPDPHAARLPAAVRETAAVLSGAGFGAWLVGECLAHLALGHTPRAFELATDAGASRCLALFPQAVPTAPGGSVVTVPTGSAPTDLVGLRWGPDVRDDLAHRDFTVLAMAWSPVDEQLVDPWQGREDLAKRRLRCVGDAPARLHEDPLRILRAARLVSEWGLSADPALESAMVTVAPSLAIVPPARQRAELCRTLLGPNAGAALALLRRTGVERRLVRGVRDDAAALVETLPGRLELRLAAWLRGARARSLLKRLRFGLERSQRVERLLAHHPLDERITPGRDRSLLRLQRQLTAVEIEDLFRLREAELAGSDADAAAHKKLAAVRSALERTRENEARAAERTRLAIGGEHVMEWLGCPPGPTVGAALRFASEWVADDPARNDPDRLREALTAWLDARGGAGSHGPDTDREEEA